MIEEIIQKAAELNLPAFLTWLVASDVLRRLGKEHIRKVYELIKNKYNEGKYAFFPDTDEVGTLKKLADRSVYSDFKKILKNHWGVDVIRTGLYITTLESRGEIERIKEIKQQVFKNKKLPGLRLIAMVTEGIIRPVLEHLKDLQKHKYLQDDIDNEFESLLSTWEKITIFVKNEDSAEMVIKNAKELIDKNEETFFIFAKGNSVNVACSALVQLQQDNYLLEKGYVWFAKTDPDTIPQSYYCAIHSSMYLFAKRLQ